MTKPTLINLYLIDYINGLSYYSFTVNLDRCMGSCNTFNDLSNKLYVPKKTEGLNLVVFNTKTETKESKILTKDILCQCKCHFDSGKCNSNQKLNNDKCWCE